MEHALLVSNACTVARACVCVLSTREQENLLRAFTAVARQRSPSKFRMVNNHLPSLDHDSSVVLRGAKKCTEREGIRSDQLRSTWPTL
eukprot:14975699-Alexandrium_andersonii.AAC.1